MDLVSVNGREFPCVMLETPHARILLIRAPRGVLGCGYVSMEAAEKFQDPLAIVTGVGSYEEMLAAPVRRVSSAAAALGVAAGDSGRDALLKMC